jgi:DNA-binding MarR family transcriptional regulator
MTHHFLKLLPLIQQLVVKLGVHRTRTGHELGMTNMLLGILDTIRRNSGCIVRSIADENLVSVPAASRMVSELVTKRLVIRESDPRDRRLVHLSITPDGDAVIQKIHAEAGIILGKMLDIMSPVELDALETGLLAFVRAMQENPAFSQGQLNKTTSE